jgi:diguanylate cyclase (GGDEF)-like protein/PAS domain S-box-containing protein
MSPSIRVLIVEDSADDAALLQHALRRGGYEITCVVVETLAAMRFALEDPNWDVITSDHAMPQFSAPDALALAKEIRPDVPFIIVSGEMDLDLAVALMRGGAKDYIPKRELSRLIPAVAREIQEAELRRERLQLDAALLKSNEKLHVHQIELELQNEELRQAQLALDTERARYFDLWDLAPVGYVTVSETGLILEANLTAVSLLGVPRTLLVNRLFSQFLLKQDLDRYFLHHRQLLETGEPQSVELRMVNDDDPPGVTWANLEATIVPDDAGECADLPGPDERGKSPRRVIRIVLSDTTKRKQAEEALRASEEKYRTIANFTYDWEAWRAPDGTYRYISPSCERISGYRAAEFMADPLLLVKIAHPDDQAGVSEHYFPPDAEAQGLEIEFDFRILHINGETRWIGHSCTPVYGDDGRWLGRRESNRDITARKESEEKIQLLIADLERLALVDEMTGIHNRHSILLLVEHEFNVAMRYRPPLSILFFDIDYFKQINDSFGHLIGDQALKQVVQVAGAAIRSADVIGRFGGDEFIVLLPQTGVQEALPLAERIRARIAALRMDTAKGPLSLTISIGIAQTIHMVLDPGDMPQNPSDTVEKLLMRADQALYAAKKAGRNSTMIYEADKTGAGSHYESG